MDLLFNNPYVPWILGIIAVVVVYRVVGSRMTIRVPGGPRGEDLLTRILGSRYAEGKVQKEIDRLKRQANWLAAGKMLEDAGRADEAAEAYLEGQENYAAAMVFEKQGKAERAAELYLQGGDYKKAAQLFSTAGKPGKAAVLFQEKGNHLEAARLFGLAGQWDKAAELYTKSGYPLRAAEAFEKCGEIGKAAEAYERHFNENVSFASGLSSGAPQSDRKSALLAGQLYEKAGDAKRAFQCYSRGSYFAEAGRLAVALGEFDKGAELYLRAEDPGSAAAAFQRAGDPVRAANLLGEVAFKQDRVAEAAAHFVEGQDYLRAAELFESVGQLDKAAAAYERGESWGAAGGVYVRAGLPERAAPCYERSGEFENAARFYEESGNEAKAIELYERAGLTFRSGEAAMKTGDRQKAIGLLQRVPANDENYRTATQYLARLFIESNMPGLAADRTQKALAGQDVSPTNLDLYYWLALAQESAGHPAEAMAIYGKIQADDLAFRDVNQRLAQLAGGGPSLPLPPPPWGSSPARPSPPARRPAPPVAQVVPPAAPSVISSPPASPAPAPTAPATAAGAKPGRFTPQGELGRGPVGIVYRALDSADGRSVALRMLPPEKLVLPETVAAFVADLKAASALSHPNLAKVLGLVTMGDKRCVITELVEGKPFSEVTRGGRRMSLQQVHGLARIVAQALAALHEKGLVHGSVQPSNIMVASGIIKLTDLGLGRLAYEPSTPENYRPPEGGLDDAADLYALAAVLYHLVTGSHPKNHPQGVGLPLPSQLVAGIPEAFDKLLVRCLHPRRELRLASAAAVLDELKGMVKLG